MVIRARTSLAGIALFCVMAALSVNTYAKDFFVSRATVNFDGRNVNPGDTITLQAGTRNGLTIKDLVGTRDRPILIRNDYSASRPVTIRRASAVKGGFVFDCNTCKHVIIDGTKKWRGAPDDAYCGAPNGKDGCGIRITSTANGDAPTVFLRLGGFTTDVTVRGVEVDGRWPKVGKGWAGFKLDDVTIKSDQYPGVWRQNVVLEQNYVHNTMREAFYIGPICCGSGGTSKGAHTGGLPLRNITIQGNLVNNAGWDGIQLKSAYRGVNRINDNVVRNVGRDRSPGIPDGEFMGVSCSDTQCDVFDNLVVNSGEHGFQARVSALPESEGPLRINIYNNVSVNAGLAGNRRAHGVNVIRASSKVARQVVAVYNNTIVRPRRDGIGVKGHNLASDTRIISNIVVDQGRFAVLAPKGSKIEGNGEGSMNAFEFVNPSNENFMLRPGSPARDAGASSLFADEDMNGIRRPQGDRPDIGAYEFIPK
jgi:hypothetical protein